MLPWDPAEPWGGPGGIRLLPSDGGDLPGTVPGSRPACISNDDFFFFLVNAALWSFASYRTEAMRGGREGPCKGPPWCHHVPAAPSI